MPSEHTPGPWRAIPNTGYVVGKEAQVAIVGAYRDKELLPFNRDRWDADAALIAAAPDLLAALRRLSDNLCDESAYFDARDLLDVLDGVGAHTGRAGAA